MSEDEIEQYEQSIKEYKRIEEEIFAYNGTLYELFDSNKDLSAYFVGRLDLYNQLLQIEFPEKYNELYNELAHATAVYGLSSDFAYITIDIVLDNIGDYYPPNELGRYITRLERQLYNKNYIPKSGSNINFEQIYFKINEEYYKDNKSASQVYDELHEIFYNKDFLQKLK